MPHKFALFVSMIVGPLLFGCSRDSADVNVNEVANTGGSKDGDATGTDTVVVSCDIGLLFEQKCGSCHGIDATFGDLDLVAPDLDARLVDTASLSCPDWPLVVAGSPERSSLYQKVASDSPPCGERMPLKDPLSSAEIACVREYILSLAGDTPVASCETCGGTTCIDFAHDPANCGACGGGCDAGEICQAGICETCSSGDQSCDGSCVDVTTSALHCGACGNTCGGGQRCVAGTCECSTGGEAVSFTADIAPLLEQSCATNGCHVESGGGNPSGKPPGAGPGDVTSDLVLSSAGAYASLVGVPSGCGDAAFVEPGDVSSSYLMNKLIGIELCGGTKMPKGGAPFTQAQLDLVGSWICAGAQNN